MFMWGQPPSAVQSSAAQLVIFVSQQSPENCDKIQRYRSGPSPSPV